MSAVLTPKVLVSGVEKTPAVVAPRVYISGVEKSPARLTPKVFISAVPKNPAVITPRVFISAVDAREVATADTLRRVSNTSWESEEVATADTSRRLLDVATADTLRRLERTEIATADTKIRRPRELRYVVETPTAQSLVNSFKNWDVTSFTVTLNERTLSDNFALETAQPMEIGDAVKGTLLDYPFSFLVEKTSQQGLIQTVRGMYDVDKQLYTQIYESGENTDLDSDSTLAASKCVNRVAGYLGLTADVKFANFTPKDAVRDTNVTYADLISTLFSWSSKLPQRQINVFIRGDTLHCIQRGMEDSVIDISDWRHSRPTIDRELVRTMWNNANSDGSNDSDDDDDKAQPLSGTIAYTTLYSTNILEYKNGLLVRDYSRTQNNKILSTIDTRYTYVARTQGTGENKATHYYLSEKTTHSTTIQDNNVKDVTFGYPSGAYLTRVEAEETTVYTYSTDREEIYLYHENETNKRREYSRKDIGWKLEDTEANDRQTFHKPVGNGFYVTSVYVNGEFQGSNLSSGKPSNEVSQYTVDRSQRGFASASIEIIEDNADDNLSAIDTTIFPIKEKKIRKELTAALKWLNRKTRETVSTEIIDKIENGVPTINHVVDFTERVILDGKEYFLVSNQVQFTPRKLIQRLQLVRWY